MELQRNKQTPTSLHQQMIENESMYQQALHNDEPFRVLKGFKNIIKELKAKLELNPLDKITFFY
jgi:hypothetical protein